MKIDMLPLGMVQANCYLLQDNKKNCVVIDPGGQGEKLIDFIEERELNPIAILLTHAHFDHIGAIDDVIAMWDVPLYIHKKEVNWLKDAKLNGSKHFGLPDVIVEKIPEKIKMDELLVVGDFTFEVFHTPGHSPGSVSFYMKNEGIVISGDALFQGSIGRTDLVDGNFDVLKKSIEENLFTLPNETIVYSGHGMSTTIGEEKLHNMYLK